MMSQVEYVKPPNTPPPSSSHSLTFLWGLDFSPLPHETVTGLVLPVNWEILLLLLPLPLSPLFFVFIPPSPAIQGTAVSYKASSSSYSSLDSTMRLSLQNDDVCFCSRSSWHHQPPPVLHPSHQWEPRGANNRVCVFAWECVRDKTRKRLLRCNQS